jgi:hypothetical protein
LFSLDDYLPPQRWPTANREVRNWRVVFERYLPQSLDRRGMVAPLFDGYIDLRKLIKSATGGCCERRIDDPHDAVLLCRGPVRRVAHGKAELSHLKRLT